MHISDPSGDIAMSGTPHSVGEREYAGQIVRVLQYECILSCEAESIGQLEFEVEKRCVSECS
jgi:2-keto-4-pentenoate hydratase/2-oxohepta-3-ene-1,7-dioic acid hydratase in catechol pathway